MTENDKESIYNATESFSNKTNCFKGENVLFEHPRKVKMINTLNIWNILALKNCSICLFITATSEIIVVLIKDALFHGG